MVCSTTAHGEGSVVGRTKISAGRVPEAWGAPKAAGVPSLGFRKLNGGESSEILKRYIEPSKDIYR